LKMLVMVMEINFYSSLITTFLVSKISQTKNSLVI